MLDEEVAPGGRLLAFSQHKEHNDMLAAQSWLQAPSRSLWICYACKVPSDRSASHSGLAEGEELHFLERWGPLVAARFLFANYKRAQMLMHVFNTSGGVRGGSERVSVASLKIRSIQDPLPPEL
jgi:hypothetical protein